MAMLKVGLSIKITFSYLNSKAFEINSKNLAEAIKLVKFRWAFSIACMYLTIKWFYIGEKKSEIFKAKTMDFLLAQTYDASLKMLKDSDVPSQE